MRARNPLYVMAKPPPDVAAQIAALPRNDAKRGPELLHSTLLSLFDLAAAPPGWLPAIVTAMNSLDSQAFSLSFNRIEVGKAVKLVSREPLVEARAFQAALVRHLLERGAPLMLGTTPVPHVTINYTDDRKGNHKIEPIGWMVREIMLVESVVGKKQHVEHGRWQLR
jgi:2'-5' RNA ligase